VGHGTVHIANPIPEVIPQEEPQQQSDTPA
jgi:hypothetical protein